MYDDHANKFSCSTDNQELIVAVFSKLMQLIDEGKLTVEKAIIAANFLCVNNCAEAHVRYPSCLEYIKAQIKETSNLAAEPTNTGSNFSC